MRKKLIDLIDKSGMVEKRSRCEIIADELIAAGVRFAPVEIASQWISAKDRLPEKEGRYIVVNESGNVFDAYYDENIVDECQFGEWVQMFDPVTLGAIDCEWRSYEEITHWMHLPELPKEVQG